jgi:xanthine dehydrogenase iron-sulfur cluster and FAD-binding subunit A
MDGRAVYSCLVLAADLAGREITTIEGLDRHGELDPVQRAFIADDAFQCGFCTPGQIMSLRALLDENPDPTDEEIERAVTGNLCRCGAYRNILAAGRRAAELQREGAARGAASSSRRPAEDRGRTASTWSNSRRRSSLGAPGPSCGTSGSGIRGSRVSKR